MTLDAAFIVILCGIVLAFMAFAGALMWSDFQTRDLKR